MRVGITPNQLSTIRKASREGGKRGMEGDRTLIAVQKELDREKAAEVGGAKMTRLVTNRGKMRN